MEITLQNPYTMDHQYIILFNSQKMSLGRVSTIEFRTILPEFNIEGTIKFFKVMFFLSIFSILVSLMDSHRIAMQLGRIVGLLLL